MTHGNPDGAVTEVKYHGRTGQRKTDMTQPGGNHQKKTRPTPSSKAKLRADLIAINQIVPETATALDNARLIDLTLQQIAAGAVHRDYMKQLILAHPGMAKACASHIGAPWTGQDGGTHEIIDDLTGILVQSGPEALQACFDHAPYQDWKPGWACGKLILVAIEKEEPWIFDFLEHNRWGLHKARTDNPQATKKSMELAFRNIIRDTVKGHSRNPLKWHTRKGITAMTKIAGMVKSGVLPESSAENWLIAEIIAAAASDDDRTRSRRTARATHDHRKGAYFEQPDMTAGLIRTIQGSPQMLGFMDPDRRTWDGLRNMTKNQAGKTPPLIGPALLTVCLGDGTPEINPDSIHPAVLHLAGKIAELTMETAEGWEPTGTGKAEERQANMQLAERMIMEIRRISIERGIQDYEILEPGKEHRNTATPAHWAGQAGNSRQG